MAAKASSNRRAPTHSESRCRKDLGGGVQLTLIVGFEEPGIHNRLGSALGDVLDPLEGQTQGPHLRARPYRVEGPSAGHELRQPSPPRRHHRVGRICTDTHLLGEIAMHAVGHEVPDHRCDLGGWCFDHLVEPIGRSLNGIIEIQLPPRFGRRS